MIVTVAMSGILRSKRLDLLHSVLVTEQLLSYLETKFIINKSTRMKIQASNTGSVLADRATLA